MNPPIGLPWKQWIARLRAEEGDGLADMIERFVNDPEPLDRCGWCRERFEQRGTRPNKFCSDACRDAATLDRKRDRASSLPSGHVVPGVNVEKW